MALKLRTAANSKEDMQSIAQLGFISLQCILNLYPRPLLTLHSDSSLLLWIAGMTHLEVSAGETALHEVSDCLCVAGNLGQVHLHSEAAAKPAGEKNINISTHNMAMWWG